MKSLGIGLVVMGLVMAAVGAVLWLLPNLPFLSSFGRLPGDIRIERGNSTFSFPIVTCLIISIVLTVLINLIARLR